MGSPLVTPEDVLESLMNDGTIDAIRLKIINQLKANTLIFKKVFLEELLSTGAAATSESQEELKNYTISMVEQSKVLNTPGAEKQTKRELFDALRQELESSVLEKASKAVWELILDNHSLGKEISETVEKIFWRLSGREPPVTAPNGEAHREREGKEKKERENDREREKEIEASDSLVRRRTLPEINIQEKETPDSSLRKRSFSELNMQGVDTIANGSADAPSGTEDCCSVPPSNPKT